MKDKIKNWIQTYKTEIILFVFVFGLVGGIFLFAYLDIHFFPHLPIIGLANKPWTIIP